MQCKGTNKAVHNNTSTHNRFWLEKFTVWWTI